MIELRPGDIFCTENPAAIGKAITFFEKLWARDNQAEYSHAGIITDKEGTTLEALWSIRGNDLEYYKGKNIVIGRWEGMTPERFQMGLNAIQDDIGKIYPLWRLPLFILPGASKWASSGKFTVCSELVCKFLLGAESGTSYCHDIGRWQGWNPDDVADMIDKWKGYTTIFNGTWEGI